VGTDREAPARSDVALGRTWLETDGLGGYAASTVALCATSRFHGLLVPAPEGGVRRYVMLSRFEETVAAGGAEVPISSCRYPGTFHPAGHERLLRFDVAPLPTWRYRVGGAEVVREVVLVRGSRTVLIRWRAVSGGALRLRLRPFLPCREAEALTFENAALDRTVRPAAGGVSFRPYAALPAVTLTWGGAAAAFRADGVWYRDVEFEDDLARGYDGREDQYSPGVLDAELAEGGELVVAATIDAPSADPRALFAVEAARRTAAGPAQTLRQRLERAAEHFLHRTPSGRLGVVAGYPWFHEWGRDTLISLPGLLLPRGRVEECGDVLSALRPWLRGGRLPNCFGATAEASTYTSVDPALWYARAVRLWDAAGGDRGRLLDELRPALSEIAAAHREASGDDLRCGADGLLRSGRGAATWMDAVFEGRAVTPRRGAPVDVNALWYLLLAYLARLSRSAGDGAADRTWSSLARKVAASFRREFVLPRGRGLADCADVPDGGGADTSVRPNMVLAASLEFSPLSRDERADVVAVARAELLTPCGLRTLSPRDPAYRARYAGDLRSRDLAYHQGTVWPWLLGPYVEASLRAHGRRREVLRHLRDLVAGLAPLLEERTLGQLAEVHDGDAPHRAGGAWAQAWSVAEALRAVALVE
jgi:predicted glycogen debranching enzyme